MSVNINFNSQILKLKNVSKGGLLGQLGQSVPFLKNIDNSSGLCTIGFSSPEPSQGMKGSGRIAALVFEAANKGESEISLTNIVANSPDGKSITFTFRPARVIVR